MKKKQEVRLCKKHGETNFRMDGARIGNRYRCCLCLSEAVQRRREKLKSLAVEYKGCECSYCGYSKCQSALEFHHTDPSEKDFGISAKGYTKSFEKMKVELDKCILLCANCHREEHARLKIE